MEKFETLLLFKRHLNFLRDFYLITSTYFFSFQKWFQLIAVLTLVNAHGRLMNPPARNAMWRFGYPNAVNYDDNELYCGGYSGNS